MQQREKIWKEKCIAYAQKHDNTFPSIQALKDFGVDTVYIKRKYGSLFKFYDYIDPKHKYKRHTGPNKENFLKERKAVAPQIYYLIHYQTHEVVDKGYIKDLREKYHFSNRTIDHLTRVWKEDFFLLSYYCYDIAKACDFNKAEYRKLMLFAYGRNQYKGKEYRKEMDKERELLLAGMYQLSDFIDVDKYHDLFEKYPPFQKHKKQYVKASELKK